MASEGRHSATGRRSVLWWDIALGVWALACVALAVATAQQVYELGRLSDTLTDASRALDTTATGLDRVADIPFIGKDVSAVVASLRQTSESALAQSRKARETIDAVAALIGIAIVVIAVVPPTVAYLTVRPSLRRPRRAP